jgi:hypothetical protein
MEKEFSQQVKTVPYSFTKCLTLLTPAVRKRLSRNQPRSRLATLKPEAPSALTKLYSPPPGPTLTKIVTKMVKKATSYLLTAVMKTPT